jgi:hypothetical protein
MMFLAEKMMTPAEWKFAAALNVLCHAPELPPSEAEEIAEDLHSTWPALTPDEAVDSYFAPLDDVVPPAGQ